MLATDAIPKFRLIADAAGRLNSLMLLPPHCDSPIFIGKTRSNPLACFDDHPTEKPEEGNRAECKKKDRRPIWLELHASKISVLVPTLIERFGPISSRAQTYRCVRCF
jgi:hypothetical protein